MRCPSCHFSNPEGFSYCGACGCSLAAGHAERRQLTVLFCDLVGSAALSERLDPESLRELIGRYRDTCVKAVYGFGGTVAQFYGDGMEVYFGYPRAHEDDPLRAVCAALELIAAVRDNLRGPGPGSLEVRIGIHTGVVVVGSLGEGAARDPMPSMGATPNLAARLQGLASPGSVLISEETLRLCKGGVHVEPLGRHPLKGFSVPREVFRVLAVDGLSQRARASGARQAPLIGRDAELGVLEQAWEASEGGRTTVVLLSGDAGIGKTRLVKALSALVATRGGTSLVGQCSALFQSSAYHPVAPLVLARLGLDPEEEVSPSTLGAILAERLPREVAGRLAPLLLSCQGHVHTACESDRLELEDALYGLLARCPAGNPTLLVVEDLHWIDPSSRDLLHRFAREPRDLPLLCVFTARSFADLGFSDREHVTHVELDGLERGGVAELVRGITGASRISEQALEEVCARTDGIPLFVEEMVGALIAEKRLFLRDDRLCLAASAGVLPLPSSLRDLLTARLDALGRLKPLAQLAAVVGRDFRLGLLAAVAGRDAENLQGDLDRLVESGILVRPLGRAAPLFGFKHALIQEAAYEGLLLSLRQTLHVQVAEVIVSEFPDLARRHPEVLAQHYAAAGRPSQAVPFWAHAGDMALERGAHQEATTQFSRALTQLLLEEPGPARDRRELDLRLRLAAALSFGRGRAHPEVEAVYARIEYLCSRLGDDPACRRAYFRARSGLQLVCQLRGPVAIALDHARELVELAEHDGDLVLRASALRSLGVAHFCLGEFRTARAWLLRSLEAARGDAAGERSGRARVLARIALAWTDWFLGHSDRARAGGEAAVAAARRESSPTVQAFAYCVLAAVHQCRQEPHVTRRLADAAEQLASQRGLPYWSAWSRMLYGHAVAARGDSQAGIQILRASLEAYRDSGAEVLVPHGLAMLAQAHADAHEPQAALEACRDGLASLASTGARFYEVELRRLEAQLAMDLGEPAARCEERLWQAIELARGQEAILLEMRCAREYARLTRSVEALRHARKRLREVDDAA